MKENYCESGATCNHRKIGKYYIFREGLPILKVCNDCRRQLEKRKRTHHLSTREWNKKLSEV